MDVAKLKEQLIADEGNVSHAYQDSEGYWTIGVGHLIDRKLGAGLDQDVIDHQLMNDMFKVETDLQSFPWWDGLSPDRKTALANLRFQLGPTRFRGFGKMLAAIEAGNFDEAARQLLDSLYAKQVPQRAARIAGQIRIG